MGDNIRCLIKREWFNWIFKKEYYYEPLTDEEYYMRFGIEKDNGTNEYMVKDEKKLKIAYEKIWEIRNFEIEKYWTRVAYFWGFIVIIFGGYISIIIGDKAAEISKMHLDLYLILLGYLFSLAWYLVSLGSKAWQLNWEAHIDFLENYVSGPVYKTIYYHNNTFYSVSKINEVMAIIIILAWIGLFIQNIYENYNFFNVNIDWFATISILLTIIFTIVLIRGYSHGGYKSEKNKFIDRWS
jgi:cell division protein FtsL